MESKKGRLISIVLAAALSMSLAACGDSDSSKKDKADTGSAAAEGASSAEEQEEKESKAEEDTTTTAAEESKAEEEVTAATKPVAEVLAEIPVPEVKSAELKEVGKLKKGDAEFYDCFLYKEESEEKDICLDYLGKPLADGKAYYVNQLGKSPFYQLYIEQTGDIEYSALMDAEGNILIDLDQKAGTYEELNDRFVKVYFPEAVTTDKSKAIYYSTSRQFSTDVKDDDVMYTGTVKLYDAKEKRFLENTAQPIDPHYTISDEFVTFYDSDSNQVIVTTDDKKLDIGSASVTGNFITEYKDGKTEVRDKDNNVLFTTKYTISTLTDTSDFYSIYDSETGLRGIMHKSGTVIVEPKYKSVDYLCDGYFTYYTDDSSKKGLLKADGTEVTKEEYKYLMYFNTPGFISAGKQDGKYDMIDTEGNAVVKDQEYGFSEGGYVKDGDKYAFFVINKKDLALKLDSSGSYLGNFLLYSNKDNAIYDLVTGDKILEGFDKAYNAYGYIYVITGDDITIYKAE